MLGRNILPTAAKNNAHGMMKANTFKVSFWFFVVVVGCCLFKERLSIFLFVILKSEYTFTTSLMHLWPLHCFASGADTHWQYSKSLSPIPVTMLPFASFTIKITECTTAFVVLEKKKIYHLRRGKWKLGILIHTHNPSNRLARAGGLREQA